MEELQCLINPFLVGEDWLEEFVSNYKDNNEDVLRQSSDCKLPFLQMLQPAETSVAAAAAETVTFPLIHEPNYFQILLRLQHEKMLEAGNRGFCSSLASSSELDNSCVKEEPDVHAQLSPEEAKSVSKRGNVVLKEKRKRKKSGSPEEAETHRMLHITIERNRRKLMNEHLNTLRSLMPSSYVKRGDQASIVGGAIDYVKEMEQLLQSLEAEKAVKKKHHHHNNNNNMILPTVSSTPSSTSTHEYSNNNGDSSAENRSDFAEIKVMVIQNHVNLKIQCQRRLGLLLKVVLTFQQLRLTILHLNISSLHSLVHYSFNLKIEDDCGLRTADDVIRAIHHIFN